MFRLEFLGIVLRHLGREFCLSPDGVSGAWESVLQSMWSGFEEGGLAGFLRYDWEALKWGCDGSTRESWRLEPTPINRASLTETVNKQGNTQISRGWPCFSPSPIFHFPSNNIYWKNLKVSQLARMSGICSSQNSNVSFTKENHEKGIWTWNKVIGRQTSIVGLFRNSANLHIILYVFDFSHNKVKTSSAW